MKRKISQHQTKLRPSETKVFSDRMNINL